MSPKNVFCYVSALSNNTVRFHNSLPHIYYSQLKYSISIGPPENIVLEDLGLEANRARRSIWLGRQNELVRQLRPKDIWTQTTIELGVNCRDTL